ncbi:unnamed protein product, partial [Polarella glacialis]
MAGKTKGGKGDFSKSGKDYIPMQVEEEDGPLPFQGGGKGGGGGNFELNNKDAPPSYDGADPGRTFKRWSWTKITPEARQAQRQAEELQALDPTVFQYDEVIDNEKEEAGMEVGSSMIRTDTALQKKKVGLTVRDNCEVGTGTKRTAKYIEKVLVATDRRKVEQQVIEDRLLKKEKEARKDCEVFVTEGFKDELKKRKKFEDELEEQEERDKRMSAEKQENGLGFASMYRNLLNGGLASSRGGAK